MRKLSIPRDTLAEIPDHTRARSTAPTRSAAPALAIEMVEDYLGNDLKINHVIEVNFENFPEFIDALGGIDVRSRSASARLRSATTARPAAAHAAFRRGEEHLKGRQALGFSRIRKNACNPREDDRDRAARQQIVRVGIRSQALSPRRSSACPGWPGTRPRP